MTGEPILLLGMGAAKAGTSWLFDQLAAHSDCHMRKIKELHYFNTVQARAWGPQIARIDARIARSRGALREDLVAWRGVLGHRRLNLSAYAAYLCGGRGGQRVVGECTPAYGLLRPRMLAGLARLSALRVVYLLRDPVERLWSNVRMDAARATRWGWTAARAARAGMERALQGHGGAWRRGDYAATLNRLDRSIGQERLHVMAYEDMTRPDALARLGAFLGITPPSAEAGRRVNAGVPMHLPRSLRARAEAALQPQYDYVERRLGHLPTGWRRAEI